jgi:hypothetical protein
MKDRTRGNFPQERREASRNAKQAVLKKAVGEGPIGELSVLGTTDPDSEDVRV